MPESYPWGPEANQSVWQSCAVESPALQLLRRHVEAGTIPGGVVLLDTGDQVEVDSAGLESFGGGPMRVDAIMRIMSMTKIIEAVAALRLVTAGRPDLDDSLSEWLPELADRRVLRSPTSDLDDTVPARRPITLRHLLTNTAGYGMILQPSPLQQAMVDNGTAAGPEPPSFGADEWLRRLAGLPLAFQPGEGWRYHHSFGLLGILISRLSGKPLGRHLADDIFEPLAMNDTAMWVPESELHRLPAAYRHENTGWIETEPVAGGFYAAPPDFDVSHNELVSTVADFHAFLRSLVDGHPADGRPLVSADQLRQLTSDQVPAGCKTADSFFPGFWDGGGWGYGVAVETEGRHQGRYGWAGGQGTDFYVDPDGTIAILFTQVELGEHMAPLLDEFRALR
jgi:CubicO group peptidase (beta-lactamase class C family)